MAEAVLAGPTVSEGWAVQVVRNESYFQLVWRRFQKSKPAIIGGLLVLMLAFLAIFAEYLRPIHWIPTIPKIHLFHQARFTSGIRKATFIGAHLLIIKSLNWSPKLLCRSGQTTKAKSIRFVFSLKAGNINYLV